MWLTWPVGLYVETLPKLSRVSLIEPVFMYASKIATLPLPSNITVPIKSIALQTCLQKIQLVLTFDMHTHTKKATSKITHRITSIPDCKRTENYY